MNILYFGDVMAEPGIRTVERLLPGLRAEHAVDFVVAQGENAEATGGKGMTPAEYDRLRAAGVDAFSGGNHTFRHKALYPLLDDPAAPVVRPANYQDMPGLPYKYVDTPRGRVLLISLMGQIVGRDADKPVENPLQAIDRILAQEEGSQRAATVVNFHGDFSSEKLIFGHYVDGRVTIAIGDHWHVPTADAQVLPKGTAHMTDVGMCGSLDSSLGVRFDVLIPRWRDGLQTKNEIETDGRMQCNALLVEVDETTGLARRAEAIRIVVPAE